MIPAPKHVEFVLKPSKIALRSQLLVHLVVLVLVVVAQLPLWATILLVLLVLWGCVYHVVRFKSQRSERWQYRAGVPVISESFNQPIKNSQPIDSNCRQSTAGQWMLLRESGGEERSVLAFRVGEYFDFGVALVLRFYPINSVAANVAVGSKVRQCWVFSDALSPKEYALLRQLVLSRGG